MDNKWNTLQALYGSLGNTTSSIEEIRQYCTETIDPGGRLSGRYGIFIAECIYQNCNQATNTVLAGRTYALTLFPAFVAIIATLAPDAVYMQYDNIWWSWLFAATSFGMSGLSNNLPEHHLRVLTTRKGREVCRAWEYKSEEPWVMARSYAVDPSLPEKQIVRFEWISFVVSLTLHVAFCTVFAWALRDSWVSFQAGSIWLTPAAWYFISAAPYFGDLFLELLLDRVELYEPSRTQASRATTEFFEMNQMGSTQGGKNALLTRTSTMDVPQYVRSGTMSSFHTFARIAYLQWARSRYRVLIRPRKNHFLVTITEFFVALGRVTVFALGSVSFGSVNLMPMPFDTVNFILLLLAASVPRFLWPILWKNGSRGADLVVRVHVVRGRDEL